MTVRRPTGAVGRPAGRADGQWLTGRRPRLWRASKAVKAAELGVEVLTPEAFAELVADHLT
ncbi:hypothetical protein ACFY7Y_30575 [Streptomyces virginiae]|uniref:hypothetical protein n=1 Tax=Streptomyces virginiae TaxID=1961 RepID=UPI00368B4344